MMEAGKALLPSHRAPPQSTARRSQCLQSVDRPEHLHPSGAGLRNQPLYRTQWHLDPGKQLVVERFCHDGATTLPDDAQWRAALAAIGSKEFSAEMWPCSEADNAEWHCSDITQGEARHRKLRDRREREEFGVGGIEVATSRAAAKAEARPPQQHDVGGDRLAVQDRWWLSPPRRKFQNARASYSYVL